MTVNERHLVYFISFQPTVSISSFYKGGQSHRRKLQSEQNVFLVTGFKRATLQCVRCAKTSSLPGFLCPLVIKKLCREMHKQTFKMTQQSEGRVGRSTCSLWLRFWTSLTCSGTEGSSSFLIYVQTSLRFLAVCDCHAHQNPPPSSPAFKVKVGQEGIVKIDSWKTQWGIWMLSAADGTAGAAECIKN